MNRKQLVITIRNYAIPKLVLEIVASPRVLLYVQHVKIRDGLGEKLFFLCHVTQTGAPFYLDGLDQRI